MVLKSKSKYKNLKGDMDKMHSIDTFIDKFYYRETKILFLVDCSLVVDLDESLCANYDGVYFSNLKDEFNCLYKAHQVDRYDVC